MSTAAIESQQPSPSKEEPTARERLERNAPDFEAYLRTLGLPNSALRANIGEHRKLMYEFANEGLASERAWRRFADTLAVAQAASPRRHELPANDFEAFVARQIEARRRMEERAHASRPRRGCDGRGTTPDGKNAPNEGKSEPGGPHAHCF